MTRKEAVQKFLEGWEHFKVHHEACGVCRKLEKKFEHHTNGEKRICLNHLLMKKALMRWG